VQVVAVIVLGEERRKAPAGCTLLLEVCLIVLRLTRRPVHGVVAGECGGVSIQRFLHGIAILQPVCPGVALLIWRWGAVREARRAAG